MNSYVQLTQGKLPSIFLLKGSRELLIESLQALKVHGYLDLDVTFDSDLTFLIGINGGGKTTAVNLIVALISPNFETLANLEFDSIRLTLTHAGKLVTLTAAKEDGNTVISLVEADSPLTIAPFVSDLDEPAYRQRERESEYYSNFENTNSAHPVLRLISNLPTPLFLDIDRRARSLRRIPRRTAAIATATTARRRNVFSASLTQSLAEATLLVNEENRELVNRQLKASEVLREELVLGNLEMKKGSLPNVLRSPTPQDQVSLTKMKEYLPTLPETLGVSRERIDLALLPLISELERLIKEFEDPKTFGEQLAEAETEDDRQTLIEKYVLYHANAPILDRFSYIIELMEKFNSKKQKVRENFDSFLRIVNEFLKDSRKEILADESGSIAVRLDRQQSLRPVTELSSGEAQIFVIFAHLYFNHAAKRANVFIVDEPELSLHIEWQEKFVDALQNANQSMQFIFATHSPSIILDRTNKCRALQ